MNAADPMVRSGAAWCDQHSRWECSRNSKRSKQRCHKPAISGLSACDNHVGETRQSAKDRGQVNLLAWSLMSDEHAAAGDLEPADVVLRSLRVSTMRADFYGEKVRLAHEEHGEGALTSELARREDAERDRVVRFAKVAHDMGISTQRMELANGLANGVVAALLAALDVAGLAPGVRSLVIDRYLERLGDLIPAGTDVVRGEVEA